MVHALRQSDALDVANPTALPMCWQPELPVARDRSGCGRTPPRFSPSARANPRALSADRNRKRTRAVCLDITDLRRCAGSLSPNPQPSQKPLVRTHSRISRPRLDGPNPVAAARLPRAGSERTITVSWCRLRPPSPPATDSFGCPPVGTLRCVEHRKGSYRLAGARSSFRGRSTHRKFGWSALASPASNIEQQTP